MLQLATLVWVLAALGGCARSGPALFDDYLTRLGRVLDAERPAATPVRALPVYPAIRDLRRDPPEIRIDLLDAWALRGCEVFKLMGERNAILGKVARPSVRLDYERRLLRLLPVCLSSEVELDAGLRAELQDILARKEATFADYVWNASVANPDYRGYWMGGSDPLGVEDGIDTEGYRAAQNALADRVESPRDGDLDAWLAALQPIQAYPMGGHSLQSMRLAMTRLDQAERMLRAAAADHRLCPMGPARKELGYARNVMVGTFIGRVQPWLVTTDQRFLAGFEALQRMAAASPIDSPELTAYLADLSDWHHRYRARIKAQVKAWKALFAACGGEATPG